MINNVFVYRKSDNTTRTAAIQRAKIAATSSGDTTLQSAADGYLYVVIDYAFTTDTDVAVKFIGGSTDISGLIKPGANGGVAASSPNGLMETGNNEALKINLSGAAVVGGHYSYAKVPIA
ncbi:MAG: hypothetical protein E6Q97_03090 [Desulfurellales bacterium]|nr:MAG: hypothetical protein E6Q97_03090 [Desulfurellales bacterium]